MWRALTDPGELASWWGEGTELDATPDGAGRFAQEGEPARLARVVEVRPERRLVLDWWPEDPDSDDPATRVTIELAPCPFGTVVTVLECVLLDLSELPVLVAPPPDVPAVPLAAPARRPGARPGVSTSPAHRPDAASVLGALGDPTRRAVLEAVAQRGPLTATALAAPSGISRQAVSKHLAVLETAGLVRARRVGRESRYEVVPGSLDPAAAWLERVGTAWDRRLARLRRHLVDD